MRLGIVSLYDLTNLGNRLQNYALFNTLSKYGEVYNIVTKSNDVEKIYSVKYRIKLFLIHLRHPYFFIRKRSFKSFDKLIAKRTCSLDGYATDFDYLFVGSDQVWNPNFITDFDFFTLSKVPSFKKIAMSPSIGVDKFSEEQKMIFKERLKSFIFLSCREKSGADLIGDITGKKCEVLIDPTLMLDSQEWDIVSKVPSFYKDCNKYILLYFLGNISDDYANVISTISIKYNLKIVNINSPKNKYYKCGPREFLWLIKNASLVLTDSFHGTVFSYIYNKPVRVFERIDSNASMNSRLSNLVAVLGLRSSIFLKSSDIIDDSIFICNYDKSILENERAKFIDYIEKAIL